MGIVLLILGTALLGTSTWGWIGFAIAVRMRESFNVATPSEFLSMSIIGVGLVIIRWLPLLGWLLVLVGILAGFILHRILRSITKKREVGSMPDFVRDSLYGMVQAMCVSYFSYIVR